MMFVDRRKRRVLCRDPFLIRSLPGLQGFILHSVTGFHRPWVLNTDHESATLWPSPLRVILVGSVLWQLRQLLPPAQ